MFVKFLLLSALMVVQGRPRDAGNTLKEVVQDITNHLPLIKHGNKFIDFTKTTANLVQVKQTKDHKRAIDYHPNGCPVDSSIEQFLPHETECDRYYQCNHGEKILRQCSAGTHFYFDEQVCDWPWIANCQNTGEDSRSEEMDSEEPKTDSSNQESDSNHKSDSQSNENYSQSSEDHSQSSKGDSQSSEESQSSEDEKSAELDYEIKTSEESENSSGESSNSSEETREDELKDIACKSLSVKVAVEVLLSKLLNKLPRSL